MRSVFLFTCIVLLAAEALAGDAGSAYTMYGIGDLRFYPSSRSAGMGYTGFGLPSSNAINTMSPASWSRIKLVRIEASALYEGINSAETDKALYQAKGLFNGATFAFPISPANGIVFVGGFTPYSFVGYNSSYTNTQNGIDYRLNEIGSGGLTKAQVGLSYAPTQEISFGASLNYLFGNLTKQTSFLPITEGISGGTLFSESENHGIDFTLSGMYTGLGTVSEALRSLSIGFAVTTQSNLKMEMKNRVVYTSEADTFGTAINQLKIPVAVGVGVGYQLADRWIFSADYYTQAWGGSTLEGQPLLNIRNSSRFGVGAEKLPLKDASKWLDKLAYRLGFSYNQTYYQVYGQPINEWSVTGGFAMPVSGETRLNIGIEYAQRGTKNQVMQPNLVLTNLVRDNIVRVSFSLSIAEPWFVRYEEE